MFNNLFNYLIKSDYIRAQILATVRHIVTAGGVALIAKGYADADTVSACAGFAVSLAGFWLAGRDVKKVDEKITVALHTPTPTNLTPEQEQEVTRLLNKLQAIKNV